MTDPYPNPSGGWYGTWTDGTPRLRTWELSPNSTRFDELVAAPSDQTLTIYWVAWAMVIAFVVIFSLIVCLGILTSRRARKNAFNFYLVYLAIPDLVFSILCGITCTMNAANNAYWSGWMCRFQYWYVVFGIGSNVWLNAVIVRELYNMVKLGHARRKYRIPTRRTVSLQAAAVYLGCAFLGTWAFYVPHVYGDAPSGLACAPVAIDRPSTIVFWTVFFPLFAGIPLGYVIYVCVDVWRRKLLPPTKTRTRLIVIYFARLVLVFVAMWIPTLVLLFVIPAFTSPFAHFMGGAWSHLQGAVSAGISLMKPDVYHAVKSFVTCRSCNDCVEDFCCCGEWFYGVGGNGDVDNVNHVENNGGRRLHPRRESPLYRSWSILPSWRAEGGSSNGNGFTVSAGGELPPAEQGRQPPQISPLPTQHGGTRSRASIIITESNEGLPSTVQNSFISGTSDRSLSSDSSSGAMNLAADQSHDIEYCNNSNNNNRPDPDCDDGSVSSQGFWPSQDETRDGDNGDASDRTDNGT